MLFPCNNCILQKFCSEPCINFLNDFDIKTFIELNVIEDCIIKCCFCKNNINVNVDKEHSHIEFFDGICSKCSFEIEFDFKIYKDLIRYTRLFLITYGFKIVILKSFKKIDQWKPVSSWTTLFEDDEILITWALC